MPVFSSCRFFRCPNKSLIVHHNGDTDSGLMLVLKQFFFLAVGDHNLQYTNYHVFVLLVYDSSCLIYAIAFIVLVYFNSLPYFKRLGGVVKFYWWWKLVVLFLSFPVQIYYWFCFKKYLEDVVGDCKRMLTVEPLPMSLDLMNCQMIELSHIFTCVFMCSKLLQLEKCFKIIITN